MRQNTTQATPFELVYDRTATLPVEKKSQEKQKKRHDNQLSDKPIEFKIEDKDNKTLTKAAHSDQLKPYHQIASSFTNNIPQLGVQ
ncbi:hypothetical protein G9A89_007927 [Geosiphon pyriformis]|nr:hypothetical protein G9A89_007927 [Geosiphon pyriformis]